MTDKENNFAKDINVPRKEQIMIDGVNVYGCVQFIQEEEDCCNLGGSCKGWPNCYYKQLARKTAECEELKKRATIAEDNFACEVQARLYHQNEWLKFSKECEELKRKLSNQEQLYQNEIEIYDKSCLQLRQENDDLYLERLALNTANSGINALLEVKEQESDRYRKALEEIEEIAKSFNINGLCFYKEINECDCCDMGADCNHLRRAKILYIINKAKGEGNGN